MTVPKRIKINQLRGYRRRINKHLRHSIDLHGLFAPLKVKKVGKYYRVLDGSERLVCCRSLGLRRIPCLIYEEHEIDDRLRLIALDNQIRFHCAQSEL